MMCNGKIALARRHPEDGKTTALDQPAMLTPVDSLSVKTIAPRDEELCQAP